MNERLIALWKRMEEEKMAIVQELNAWSATELSAAPEGRWNALQVVEHLITSEFGTFGYMRKKTSSGWEGLPKANDLEKANGQALSKRLASDERYKAPAVLPDPTGSEDMSAMFARWSDIRRDAESFLKGLDPEFYDRTVFKQPFAGPIDLYDTLDFIGNHIAHHRPQIQRLKDGF